jgi:serpin B
MKRLTTIIPVLGLALAGALMLAVAAGRAKGGGAMLTTQATPESAVVAGNSQFAFDLYAKLRGGEGNLFFSPYSISTALAMTSVAARGETDRQIAATLHLPLDPQERHQGFHSLLAGINGEGEAQPRSDKLVTANALWLQKGEPFLAAFLESAKTNYGSAAFEVDYRANAEAARQQINDWVERQTADKIRDLVPSSALSPDTSLVLTNAIYFKGAWAHPFTETSTRKEDTFRAPGGRKVPTPMMVQSETFRYLDGGLFQMLELPYDRNARAMVVLLPKDVDGLGALESSLNEKNLAAWLGKLANHKVNVELPRFHVEASFSLRDMLLALGMKDPFDLEKADFSGLTGRREHAISAVLHKAFVDVDEKGTEAAAATAVVMMRASAVFRPEEPIKFRADHPFLFLIRDQKTGAILFLGRVTNPKA